jgi:hypothetical protein
MSPGFWPLTRPCDAEINHDRARRHSSWPRSVDLSASYHFKEAADYETGVAGAISSDDATEAIRTAEHFLAVIKSVLDAS